MIFNEVGQNFDPERCKHPADTSSKFSDLETEDTRAFVLIPSEVVQCEKHCLLTNLQLVYLRSQFDYRNTLRSVKKRMLKQICCVSEGLH